MASVSSLDSVIAQQSLLLHPFYVRWSKGQLSLEDMKVYAKEYYHVVRTVPVIVSKVLECAKTTHPEMLPFIAENLKEEQEHVELWERFGRSMGISSGELQGYQPSQAVIDAVADMETLAEGSFEDGVAAMYSMEAELPAIAKTKKDGLCAYYGLTSDDALVYFEEHEKEEEHLKVWRKVSVNALQSRKVARAMGSALNRVLDGVCERSGIDLCDCTA